MKKIISLCGVFLATALIIPSVITLTYRKANEGLHLDAAEIVETVQIPNTVTDSAADESLPDDDPVETGEAEDVGEPLQMPRVYASSAPKNTEIIDRYTYYSPEFDSEWNEEEDRVLGALTEEITETAEEETAKVLETTVPETTKVSETKSSDTAKTEPAAPVNEVKTQDAPKNTTGEYVGCDAKTIKVYIKSTGKYAEMLMGDYLIGVVAAEMPVRFDIEALKAQAVASRTFAVFKSQSSSYYHSAAHGSEGSDVCTNSGHCQAYLSYESALASWSDRQYVKNVYDKIKRAVIETSGIVATYNGKPIEAVFHASSYGSTDSIANVWGGAVSCLIGVSTPETLDTAHVYSKETFTSAEVKSRVLSRNGNAEFSSDPSEWMKITLNNNGRVKTLQIGNTTVTGQTSKSMFGLSSTNYKVTYNKEKDTFIFEVYGWGHGVGMSQYGAGIYAEQGKDYEFIIKHYYNGVSLTLWN